MPLLDRIKNRVTRHLLEPAKKSLDAAKYALEGEKKFRAKYFADVPVAYIPSIRDGQPWYYLIAGSFASVQESSAAERVLKNVQSGLKPWTRRFGGMQALIKP